MLAQCQNLTQELTEVQNNQPVLDDYKNVDSGNTLDQTSVGTITIQKGKSAGTSLTKHHKVPDYTTLKYKCLTGSKGSEPHQFNEPIYVTCTDDQIIVSDQRNHRVKFYNNNLELVFVVGEKGSGQGQFHPPAGLAVGPCGEIFVSDITNSRIVVLSSEGEYLREFGTRGTGDNQLHAPLGIAISGEFLFICDSYNYRVKVVRLDGSFVRHIGSEGNMPGEFVNRPKGIAVMSPRDGRVLVKEKKKSHLHVYTRTGQYLGLFPPSLPTDLATALPNCITVDPFDNVLITYNTGVLVVYDKTGKLIVVIGTHGTGQEEFKSPFGIAVNTTEGFLVVADKNNHRVQKLDFCYNLH